MSVGLSIILSQDIQAFNFICSPIQARSQDLEKGGGGGAILKTTLTRIFIVLESVSLGMLGN